MPVQGKTLMYALAIAAALAVGQPAAADRLLAYHFDVGQADMTLIQSGGCNVLIDAGRWDRNDVLGHLERVGVSQIHILIATHPHADHIGQMDQVIERYAVGQLWATGWEHDSRTFERFLDAALEDDLSYYEVRAGGGVQCGDMAMRVIHPVDPLEGIHDGVAVRIEHEHATLLYTGDAEAAHEREMLARGENVEADVLHLGHHGSSTSTIPEFLSAVDPKMVIYSAGRDNRYGHPHGEVIERVKNHGAAVYGTAEHGTIVIGADAAGIQVRVEHGAGGPENSISGDECIDLNTASASQLLQLEGITPRLAGVLMSARQSQPFESTAEITRVQGIGQGQRDAILEHGGACVH